MDLDSALTGKPAEGTGATELLRADHGEVKRLFAEYDRADGAAQTRHVIAETLALQLELHDAIESEVFYPAVEASASELVEAAMDAHATVADLIQRLNEEDDDARRDEIVAQLKAAVEAHVREEEEALVPRVEQIGTAALGKLGAEMVKRKEELTRSTETFEGPAT